MEHASCRRRVLPLLAACIFALFLIFHLPSLQDTPVRATAFNHFQVTIDDHSELSGGLRPVNSTLDVSICFPIGFPSLG